MMMTRGVMPVFLLTLVLAGTSATEAQVLRPSELCSEHSLAAIATFEDANLEAQIRAALSVGDRDDLTCGLVSGLTEFDAGRSGIASLVGIQNLTGLMVLNLGSNPFSDISALSGLTGLTELRLWRTVIPDLGPLSGLTGLTELHLGGGAISDLSPLSGFTSLTDLRLGGNVISDLGPLSGLTSLTVLHLQNSSISDISALSGLTGLTLLLLNNNSISDLSALSGLTDLTELWLDENSISDISALSGLTGLTELRLDKNLITDIGPLSGLTGLTDLRLSYNSITDIGPLSGLTSMRNLMLHNNSINDVSALSGLLSLTSLALNHNPSNIQPLLDNAGLGAGDDVFLRYTNVTCPDVALLQANEVTVASNCKGAMSYRVLFLGNSTFSYSGGIYQPFEGFCAAAGLDCEAVWQDGQSPSIRHGIELLGYGRIPTRALDIARAEWIHSMIELGGFDYVVLDRSRPGWLMPDWVERTEAAGRPQDPYEETLAAYAEIHRTIVESGAETVLFARTISPSLINWSQPLTQVVVRLGADLGRVEINGERHPVPVVPLISLVLDAVTEFSVEEWFMDDLVHPNQLAQYASACMVFTYMTGLDPRQSPFRDLGRLWESPEDSPTEQVSDEAAAWIKNQVWLYYTTRH